jgi:exodeoxyribonuclease VII large subunit
MDQNIFFTPSEFVAVINQTFEYSYPIVTVEGELTEFRVSKNRWVYFKLQDEEASVSFFGTVYHLPGPLEDGLNIRVVGAPRLHPRFGFSVNVQSMMPVGEGSLKKAADLLRQQLEKEGLFAPERKRPLPRLPVSVGLITAANSAASADFIKILNERWGGLAIHLADVYVQGDKAPLQIVRAIEYFNSHKEQPEILVITRGGGSAEDLAAFNDERVVRAVAASRIPTLVAIGHEVDISLAELAADQRASTPSNAAQLLVPDKHNELLHLKTHATTLSRFIKVAYENEALGLQGIGESLRTIVNNLVLAERDRLKASRKLALLYDPYGALKRGYALISKGAVHITRVTQVKPGDSLAIRLQDGTITSIADKISKKGKAQSAQENA